MASHLCPSHVLADLEQCICTAMGLKRNLHHEHIWEKAHALWAFCRYGLPIYQQDFRQAWHQSGRLHRRCWSCCCGQSLRQITFFALLKTKSDPWKGRSLCPLSEVEQIENGALHIQYNSSLSCSGSGSDRTAHPNSAKLNLGRMLFRFQSTYLHLQVFQFQKEFW